MLSYKLETHCHTREVSICSHLAVQDLVAQYRRAGYAGLVITDHLNQPSWAGFESLAWPEKVTRFLSGYRQACQAAQGQLAILLGMELHFYENENDYLIYGLTEDLLYRSPVDYRQMGLTAFQKYARSNGLLIYQAHPFRRGMTIVDPNLLDGLEIYNSHPRHDSRNEIAEQWAVRFNLAPIGGSDCHQSQDVAGSGILINRAIQDMSELMQILQAREYAILYNQK